MSERPASEIAYSTEDRIVVRGLDLSDEIIGRVGLGDMAFLELTGRLPDDDESVLFNAMVVALVEHGLTPSVLASRLTHLGAPESLQGAVAAGLLGVGSTFVGTIEGAARMLQQALADAGETADLAAIAADVVADHRSRRAAIPGIGHPIHRSGDPRTARLFALAAERGRSGRHIALLQLIAEEAERRYERTLPINATGAIGAISGELGLPWRVGRGLGLIARTIGLVAHLLEEMERPIAGDIWEQTW